jgi:RND family efflux transporter MFP subunit
MEKNNMSSIRNIISLIVFLLLFPLLPLNAQNDKPRGIPPAQVVVSEMTSGMVAPEAEFVGTVYYQEKSEVAAEVNGKVEEVNFEEGQRVKKGDVLVKLNSELLEKTLKATIASYEQVLSDLEQAKKDLVRAESLYKEQLISDQRYDLNRLNVKRFENKAASLKADVDRFEIELQKKAIKAPYDGVVVKKNVDRGEWLSPDSTAMTIAKDDFMMPVVNVPERIIIFIKVNQYVAVRVGENVIKGKVVAIVPKGDTSTRTFPVKIGIINTMSLIEGMEARVTLPIGKKEKSLTVQRDAVITVFGNTVVYAVVESKAMMIPVKVVGYKGMIAGIHAEGLKEGMKVVVKGNERLRPGQMVKIKNNNAN